MVNTAVRGVAPPAVGIVAEDDHETRDERDRADSDPCLANYGLRENGGCGVSRLRQGALLYFLPDKNGRIRLKRYRDEMPVSIKCGPDHFTCPTTRPRTSSAPPPRTP